MPTLAASAGPAAAGLGRPNVMLRDYTTFRIGGPARCFFEPRDRRELRLTFGALQRMGQVPFYILGGGSKLLISDEGVDAAVISMRRFEDRYIARFGTRVRVSAGFQLRRLLACAAEWGLAGLEDLAGIPGTVGGAIRMNAGTPRVAIGDRVAHVELMDRHGVALRVPAAAIRWQYRNTDLGGRVVMYVELQLALASPDELRRRAAEAYERKRASQPLSLPSAGCFFKNPALGPAGRLLDQAGLKGVENGRAAVSVKHANFIVNRGGATAQDVLALVRRVREVIKQHYGIELEAEVCVWPYGAETGH